jgi:hypothetical protein
MEPSHRSVRKAQADLSVYALTASTAGKQLVADRTGGGDPAIPGREERSVVRHAVRERAKALGFEPLRPRPKWVAKGWIVERRF